MGWNVLFRQGKTHAKPILEGFHVEGKGNGKEVT